MGIKIMEKCICGSDSFRSAFEYHSPPKGETKFAFSAGSSYYRELLCCRLCGHFISRHKMNNGGLYDGDYCTTNYKDEDGIRKEFDKIINLPIDKSDNICRVNRIVKFADVHFLMDGNINRDISILDIGSGLCVFLYEMKKVFWKCVALDPDYGAAMHAEKVVGVKSIYADFIKASDIGKYDIITFNKVLEHVQDPIAMLNKATNNLNQGGFVYVEVPDGELAALQGMEREEFFIEHRHVFSLESMKLLAMRAGFNVDVIERLQEPSSKFTLRAFLTPKIVS